MNFISVKLFLTLIVSITISCTAYTQSIFHLKYQFPTNGNIINRQAFLVRFNNGTGFYRVNFFDETVKKNIVVELQTEEEFAVNEDGSVNTNKFYLKGLNPQNIDSNKSISYIPEIFCFQKDPQTGTYEPLGVTMPGAKAVAQGVFLESPRLLTEDDLTIEFVSSFFKETDQFYKNTFGEIGSRGQTPEEKATKLYLIAVANTEAKDIGTSCMTDQARNIKTFTTLVVFLGIQIIITKVDGKNYSKDIVQNAIDSLNPSANDIVIFCYSGHGFTIPKKNKKQKFPNIDLRPLSGGNYLDFSINMEDIFNRIKKKGARFNLVMSDCCNDDPNATNIIANDIAQTRDGGLRWSMENCKNLFMNSTPKSILLGSTSIGERASGTVKEGGFFSLYFKVAMETYFSRLKTNVTWDDIVKDAIKETTESVKQHPIYKIL